METYFEIRTKKPVQIMTNRTKHRKNFHITYGYVQFIFFYYTINLYILCIFHLGKVVIVINK